MRDTAPMTPAQAVARLTALLGEARAEMARLHQAGRAHPMYHAPYSVAEHLRAAGAVVHMTTTPPRMTWAGITVTRAEGGLALFDAWLRKAAEDRPVGSK